MFLEGVGVQHPDGWGKFMDLSYSGHWIIYHRRLEQITETRLSLVWSLVYGLKLDRGYGGIGMVVFLSSALDCSVAIATAPTFSTIFYTNSADTYSWWGWTIYKVHRHLLRVTKMLLTKSSRILGTGRVGGTNHYIREKSSASGYEKANRYWPCTKDSQAWNPQTLDSMRIRCYKFYIEAEDMIQTNGVEGYRCRPVESTIAMHQEYTNALSCNVDTVTQTLSRDSREPRLL